LLLHVQSYPVVHQRCMERARECAMGTRKSPARQRFGLVSVYDHHGSWYLYFHNGQRRVRQRAGINRSVAEVRASLLNAKLVATQAAIAIAKELSAIFQHDAPVDQQVSEPCLVTVPELRRRFLDHHEKVQGSSLATILRYAAATSHLERFVGAVGADRIDVMAFAQHLRTI